MSDLTSIQRIKFERLLEMGSGYVSDFSNRTFQDFVLEQTGIDIYDQKYAGYSGSKASRLREFWKVESNYLAGKLTNALLDYWSSQRTEMDAQQSQLYDECRKIAENLLLNTAVEHIDALKPNSDDLDFAVLTKLLREGLGRGELRESLDRLHTFVIGYVRNLCKKHAVPFDETMPLHGLFGAYVKHLKNSKLVESEMTMHILRSSIAVLDAFNKVRNEKSFAHHNQLLNYDESLLIVNNVCSTIRFIESLEKKIDNEKETANDTTMLPATEISVSDLPF
jgi:hypothetical protein